MSGKVVFTVGAVLRGDDAAGPMLAKMMQDRPVAGWEVIDGGQTPEDELAVIRRMRPDVLLLVDAAEMGLEPGAVRSVQEHQMVREFLVTTHSLPISFLLSELKQACGNVVFLGIQPAQLEFMGPLSPEVRAAVERIYDSLARGASFSAGIDGLDDPTAAGERGE